MVPRAGLTLLILLIDYKKNIPVRIIVVPPVVPPFPIADVVGFELIFRAIFSCVICEISTLI